MLKNKSNNKSEELETIQHLHFGQEITKFYKESKIGDGHSKDIKMTITDCSKYLSLKSSNMKVHTFLIFLHLLSME